MFSQRMRRIAAATALATLATPIASAANLISITLHDVVDLDTASTTYLEPVEDGAVNGMPYGTELNVEWWQWDDSAQRAYKNDRCSYTIGVDEDGNLYRSDDVEYRQYTSGHNFSLKRGCNPMGAAHENSFLRVYPTENSQTSTPVVLTQSLASSGRTRNLATAFQLASKDDRGSDTPWSLSDACEVTAFAVSGSETVFSAVDVNADPVVNENGEDVSYTGGVVILPARSANGTDALAICDAGFIPDADARFPDATATFSTEAPAQLPTRAAPETIDDNLNTRSFSNAPDTDFQTVVQDDFSNFMVLGDAFQSALNPINNEDGQGLKDSNFRQGSFRTDDADILSILTYNVQAEPPIEEDAAAFQACAEAGQGTSTTCNNEVGRRQELVEEIAESIAISGPDVIVLTGLQQDAVSGFGIDNWGTATVRDALKNALPAYNFADAAPAAPSSTSGFPVACDSILTTLLPDEDIYADQSPTDMSQYTYCDDPSGEALDSGVLIGVRTSIGIENQAFRRYQAARGIDAAKSQGVKYVEIQKGSQTYHIFGTQLQSGRDSCVARTAQSRDLVDYIMDMTDVENDNSERVVLTGNFNADPVRSNHLRTDPDGLGLSCRNEMEYLIQNLRSKVVMETSRETVNLVRLSPNSMPFSNDCVENEIAETEDESCLAAQAGEDGSQFLDHTIWMAAKPLRSGSVFFRQTADGDDLADLNEGDDLSAHYPLLSVLDYRAFSNSLADPTFNQYYDYASTRGIGFPVTCSSGVVEAYKELGTDFRLNPGPVDLDGEPYFSGSRQPVEKGDAHSELVCMPTECDDEISSESGHTCNPATYAAPNDGVRKVCGEGPENHLAGCLIPAGYENLAKLPGVVFETSSERDPVTTKVEFIADGKIYVDGDADPVGQGRSWMAEDPDVGRVWIKITFPEAQYVKRIRFWNLPGLYGTTSYEVTYTDDEGVEHPFSNEGEAYYDAAVHPSETYDFGRRKLTQSTLAWNNVELINSVPAKSITIHCHGQETGYCGFSEVEVYGGAE